MNDPIRKLTPAERAQAAAKRTAETGIAEPNPFYNDTDGGDFLLWQAAYADALSAALAGQEGGA